jgi:hypothetical protein
VPDFYCIHAGLWREKRVMKRVLPFVGFFDFVLSYCHPLEVIQRSRRVHLRDDLAA